MFMGRMLIDLIRRKRRDKIENREEDHGEFFFLSTVRIVSYKILLAISFGSGRASLPVGAIALILLAVLVSQLTQLI